MLFAKNLVKVVPGYSEGATFTSFFTSEPVSKLTVRVLDADVICQTTELIPVHFEAVEGSEMYLERGFHSLVPLVPFTGFRFRAVAGDARVHIRAYGYGSPA